VKRAQLFLTLLLLLLPLPVAAESWCALYAGGDWTCYNSSSYTPATGAFGICGAGQSFSDCCTTKLGGSYYINTAPAECQQVCCCTEGGNTAYENTPISLKRCQTYGNYSIASAVPDCTATTACGGGGPGGQGKTYNVTGKVYDLETGVAKSLESARVEYPVGSRLVTFYTDSDGAFTLANVPAGTITFKASKLGCGEQQSTRDITGTITDLNFNLNCATGNCAASAVNDTKAVPVAGQPKVTVSWTPSTCTNIQGYALYRCEGTADSCTGDVPVGFALKEEGTFTDTITPIPQSWPQSTGFCYKVKAINSTGGEIDQALPPGSQAHCILPMNPTCLSGNSGGSQCYNQDTTLQPIDTTGKPIMSFTGSAHCDATNRIQIDQNCSGGTFCYYNSADMPGCRAPTDCEKCNGLFGFFVDLGAKVTGGASCSQLAGCVLDNAGYATDTFRSCGEISSCYDYHTKGACETGTTTDKCHTSPGGCKWNDVAGFTEIGKGICVPKSAAAPPGCQKCNDVFGKCDATLCAAMGPTCYYTQLSAAALDVEPEGCIDKSEMACRFYNNQQDCTGGKDVKVDVTYDEPSSSTSNRIAGTHSVTPSNDKLGLGKCAWVSALTSQGNGYCVKNANGRLAPIPWLDNKIEDDCFETEGVSFPAGIGLLGCLRDITPPVTTLPFAPGSYIDADRLRQTKPIVSDDTFPPSELSTRFCLVLSGGSCYPDKRIENLVPDQLGVGSYTLYYYSEDPAGNLEPMKSMNLNIDQDSNAHLVEATLMR
jgi:hypothetical protein